MSDEMFPPTAAERLAAVRKGLEADVDRRGKAIASAEKKLEAAENNLAQFDLAMAALADQLKDAKEGLAAKAGGVMDGVLAATVEAVNAGALDTDDLTVRATLGGAPATANVPPAVEPDSSDAPPLVYVLDPGATETRAVAVGERTRFSNLVAGYLADLPADDPRKDDDLADYKVVERATGLSRYLATVVQKADYGKEFAVVPIGRIHDL